LSPEEKGIIAEILRDHALARSSLSALISSAHELGQEQFRELVKDLPCAGYLDEESIRD
jgi:hypothetical protein